MKLNRPMIALIGAISVAAVSSPASAGTKDDVRALQERMNRVEQSLAGQSAQMVRVSELESQIQSMTGLIEELTYQLDIANQRLDAVSAALAGDSLGADAAAQGFAFGGAPTSGPVDLTTGDPIADQLRGDAIAAPAPTPGAAAGDIALPLNPDAAYDYASGFLLKGDYQRAKSAFELYVEAFPNHSRTPDAKFRLGEIYLALGENTSAADLFIGHIRSYPNDPRAAEAYLKLGTAFARLEKPEEACTVFKTMKTKYADAATAVTQRANLEMARINCQ
ncbi:Cell division coordinator CpoB [Durusdinium trenchii]|uniref:Cell division coordinator CpoB n=1 Tax=Durusdinium trenchii TaxID=1381693 RepID=A0ABP0LMK9_9DINO